MPASRPARADAPGSRAPAYVIAGLVHAAAMLMAFPPVGWWPLTLVAPIPLVWAGWLRGRDLGRMPKGSRLGRGPLMVSLGAMPLHLYAHQWVMDVSAAGYIPFVVIMSSMAGLTVWMISNVRARWPRLPLLVVGPIGWSAIEVFRGEVLCSGYPWILIAHPLIDAPLFPAAASLLGTYFAGFLVVVVAAAVVELIVEDNRGIRFLVAIGAVVVVVGAGAALRPGDSTQASLKFGVVQTNIPQSNKLEWGFEARLRDMGRFADLTRDAAMKGPDVIVWPETMFPGLSLSAQTIQEERAQQLTFDVPPSIDPRGRIPSTEFFDRLSTLSRDVGVPMLVGALGFDGFRILAHPSGGIQFQHEARYNSVFRVQGGEIDPVPYSKLELTPFGEVMPGIRHWPWLQSQLLAIGAGGMTFDLSPGPGPRAFSIGEIDIVTPICFEATKPRLCRRLVRATGSGPVAMVNVTNDGWFGDFRAGRLQHLQIARWRCVELGVPMVRAANTGVSCAIDARGRVIASGVDAKPGAWNQDGVLTVSVRAASARTVYARIGEVFGWAVLSGGLAVWMVALATFRRPREV